MKIAKLIWPPGYTIIHSEVIKNRDGTLTAWILAKDRDGKQREFKCPYEEGGTICIPFELGPVYHFGNRD